MQDIQRSSFYAQLTKQPLSAYQTLMHHFGGELTDPSRLCRMRPISRPVVNDSICAQEQQIVQKLGNCTVSPARNFLAHGAQICRAFDDICVVRRHVAAQLRNGTPKNVTVTK